jgi:hypothetical protein
MYNLGARKEMVDHLETGAYFGYNTHMDICSGDLVILTSNHAWAESTSSPERLSGHELVVSLETPTEGSCWVLHPAKGRLLVNSRQLLPVIPEDGPAENPMCNGESLRCNIGIPGAAGDSPIGFLVVSNTSNRGNIKCPAHPIRLTSAP